MSLEWSMKEKNQMMVLQRYVEMPVLWLEHHKDFANEKVCKKAWSSWKESFKGMYNLREIKEVIQTCTSKYERPTAKSWN